MKFKSVPAALALAIIFLTTLVSCNSHEDLLVESKSMVHVNISTFDYTQEDFQSRAAASDAVSRIAFAVFDASGNRVESISQAKGTDGNFGTITCELDPGTYTFVAVGHRVTTADAAADVVAEISSPTLATLPEYGITDTFSGAKTIEVKPHTDIDLALTLPRIVTLFSLYTLDPVPSNVSSMTLEFNPTSEYSLSDTDPKVFASFNPTTGLATQKWHHSVTLDATSFHGESSAYFNYYTLLTADEQNLDITITAYDSEGGEVLSRTLTAPMKRNRKTTAQGRFFSAPLDQALQFNNTWLEELIVGF